MNHVTIGCFCIILTMCASSAQAMHISEGILPLPWAAFWFILSAPFIFLGLKRLKERTAQDPQMKALVGLVGAGVFIISCMPIPMPNGTCSHPCGTGIAAILIGPALATLTASVALTLQALFLAHGGLTTLGANIFSMGVVGSFTGYLAFKGVQRLGFSPLIAAFCAGLLSDWATYTATSVSLAGALAVDGSFFTWLTVIFLAFVPTQLPLGIIEGFIALGAYEFIHSRRPEFLEPQRRPA
jgi:cobalt/nickel transport system permease protein